MSKQPHPSPRYTEWLHLQNDGQWPNGVPSWARDHRGQMNDVTALRAVVEELAAMVTAPAQHADDRPDSTAVVEFLARQWDGCEFDDVGGMTDIGDAIRRSGLRFALGTAVPAEASEDALQQQSP